MQEKTEREWRWPLLTPPLFVVEDASAYNVYFFGIVYNDKPCGRGSPPTIPVWKRLGPGIGDHLLSDARLSDLVEGCSSRSWEEHSDPLAID